MRYMLGGVVAVTPEEAIYTRRQITPAQGHPTKTKIALMAALLPHMRQATDVMRRLGKSAQARATFEHTLEWLVDGVVLLANDGSVIYANAAAQKVFRSNDGITVARGALRFGSGDGRLEIRRRDAGGRPLARSRADR